jgi:hypothetical protein
MHIRFVFRITCANYFYCDLGKDILMKEEYKRVLDFVRSGSEMYQTYLNTVEQDLSGLDLDVDENAERALALVSASNYYSGHVDAYSNIESYVLLIGEMSLNAEPDNQKLL